jgi:ABC-type transport system involved in multi-copper enzyme maturation permease subunit
MNLPASLFVVRCLVRDTFRQSLASRTFWLILGLSALCIVLCLSVRLEGYTAATPKGEIELFGPDRQPYTGLNQGGGTFSVGFGAIRLRQFRDGQSEVVFLQTVLAKWGVGAVGLLLVLLWTSGFLPEFLDPRAATVLLAKPVPRWSLLAGKYLGVLAFVAFQASVFVGGTWLALGLATDVWHPAYLLTVPLLVTEFAVLYSVSALLAVWTRSTVVCIFGTLLFWALCSSIDVSRHAAATAEGGAAKARPALEAAYWVLPKPADVVLLLDGVLQSDRHFQGPPAQQAMQKAVDPELSLLTSLLFTGAVLGLAGRRFVTREY